MPFRQTLRVLLDNRCDVVIGEAIGANLFEERSDVTSQEDCVIP